MVFGNDWISDILAAQKGLNKSEWQRAFNEILSKHFDYVLCKPDDLSVIATVEPDDSSHNSKKAIARDTFLEGA